MEVEVDVDEVEDGGGDDVLAVVLVLVVLVELVLVVLVLVVLVPVVLVPVLVVDDGAAPGTTAGTCAAKSIIVSGQPIAFEGTYRSKSR